MNKLIAGGFGLIVFMVIVIPGIIAIGGNLLFGKSEVSTKETGNVVVRVYLHQEDKVASMPLERYIKGVVAAEMPAGFELEALKAQAVAARTYAVKHMHSFGGEGAADKPEADVSTDFTKSQAWVDDKTLKTRWGKHFKRYSAKIAKAVEETAGQIAVYQDQPINAVFHSTSGERTASAKEIWGGDFPYLQSVECKWDKASPRYREEKELTLASLGKLLGDDAQVMAAAQGGGNEIAKVLSHTESGRVKEVRIGVKTLSGEEARDLLGLRSENFSVKTQGDKVVFTTTGYGHGVGMCQYGANGMAKEGEKYEAILKHYYTGIEIKNIYHR